jgi:hypothetical protein
VDEKQAPEHHPAMPVWAGTERSVAATTRINAGLLLDSDPVTVALAVAEQPLPVADGELPMGLPAGHGTAAEALATTAVPSAGTEGSVAGAVQLTAAEELATEGLLAEDRDGGALEVTAKVPVPALTAAAIGLCVAVTVVFGIIPAPLVDLAHKATLLFVP